MVRLKPERIQSPKVASILGVTTRAVQEMAARGELPSAASPLCPAPRIMP